MAAVGRFRNHPSSASARHDLLYLGVMPQGRSLARTLGLSEPTAFDWSVSLLAYWTWMMLLLALSLGRVHGLCLLIATMIGFSLRRGSSLKWVLVILTFEGAIRVGLLFSLCAMAWREL